MIFDQPGSYRNSDLINDGVTIAADDVTLTNASGGVIRGGGVSLTEGGSTFVNELGAEVGERNSNAWYPNVLVQGSSGSDTVINAGFVWGQVRLGDGDDVFVDRNGAVQGVGWEIYLEGGDDVLRIEAGGARDGSTFANGGDGYDTVVVASPDGDPRRAGLFGFERLVLESGGNIDGYSGFQTIELTSTRPYTFYNFLDCRNPGADLVLSDGDWVQLARSQVRSITGSEQGDFVQLVSGGFYSQAAGVLNSVILGGGNDSFTIDGFYGGVSPAVGGSIDGGEGVDTFNLVVGDGEGSGGAISLDFAQATGFEQLYVNAHYTYLDASVTLSNLAGFQTILAGEMTNLVLSSTALPNAELRGAAGGSVTLASDVVIGSYSAHRFDPPPGSPVVTQVDLSASVTFVNNGTVTASIRFAGGSDLYDGRQGSVGGIVDGGAGDDLLLGGVGADWLDGGAGNDTLDGGAGSDVLRGGIGDDYYIVDTASDRTVEAPGEGFDTVFTATSLTLEAGSEIEAVRAADAASTVSLTLTGNSFGQILAGSAGGDRLEGGGGDDYLEGRAGSDTLDGGTGADTMIGGAGDDYYLFDDASDRMFEHAGEGFDTAFTSIGLALAAGDSIEAIRAMETPGVSLTLVGNDLGQIVAGNDETNKLYGLGGDDYLEGRGGVDTLDGGTGADTLRGGTGDDYYIIDNSGDRILENANEGFDTTFVDASFALEAGMEVEALRAGDASSTFRMDLWGNAFGQVLAGNAGVNLLSGGGGADYLEARGGDDRLDGGAGDDVLIGGTGEDIFAFGETGFTDRVLDFVSGTDRIDLRGIDAVVATVGDDAFTWIGDTEFGNVAGQLRSYLDRGNYYLAGDVDGDGAADFLIDLGSTLTIPTDLLF